ncbi:hypothetical protein HDU89_006275 [Geranomyces variabilis]|nr:hypothetical protein HDU89_006275 [Geranomyces variabilis]
MRDAQANAPERLLRDANEPSAASPAPNLPARDPLVQLAKVQCNGEEYIAADDVKAKFPQLFQDCGRNTRGILKRASPGGSPILKSSDHVFAMQKKAGWMAAEGCNKRAKLLVTPAWVRQQVCLNSTQADENKTVDAQSAAPLSGVDAEAHEASDEPSADDGAGEDADQNAAPADLEDAPEVLSLEEAEKFQNEDGEPQEVETRGVRAANGIFFRANDVSMLVSEHRLWVTNRVTHPNSSFERGPEKDFVSFKVLVDEDGRPRACSRLFLTYRGLVRIMNVSRTPAARRFCDWAVALLQAAQMGSPEQRQEAAASILGTPLAKVREALSSFSPKPSGVYLLSLGTVGQLCKSMEIANNIPDAHIVLKWGETGDLDDRFRKHLGDYGRIQYFREAGWLLRSSGYKVLQGGSKRFKARVELAAVPKASLKHVQAFYDGQQAMYGGNVKEFVARLNALQDQIGHERALYEEKLARKDDAIAHKTEMIARLEAMLAQQEEMASLRAIAHRYELAEARRR